MSPTRRRYLAGLCISLTGGSGCAAFERESQPELTIPELWIDNKNDLDHRVEILLLHDDDPVFVKSVAVDAATYEADSLKATGGQAWEDVAPTARTYTLHVRIDENDWFTANFENEESGCVRVAVEIDRRGTGSFVYFGCE